MKPNVALLLMTFVTVATIALSMPIILVKDVRL